VSRSIRNPDHGDEAARAPRPRPAPTGQDEPGDQDGHEKLLADLDAFATGEAEAKAEAGSGASAPDPVAGPSTSDTRWPDSPDPDTSPSDGWEEPPGRTTP
jgi:hypothetical protein